MESRFLIYLFIVLRFVMQKRKRKKKKHVCVDEGATNINAFSLAGKRW